MKECPKCHTQYDDSMNFCTKDGRQLRNVAEVITNNSDKTKNVHSGKVRKFIKFLKVLIVLSLIVVALIVYWYRSQPVYYIYPENSKIEVDGDAGETRININTNAPYSKWRVRSNAKWIDLSKAEDHIVIKYKANDNYCDNDDRTRSSYIYLVCDDRDKTQESIKIVQPESKEIPRLKIKNVSVENSTEGDINVSVVFKTRYMQYVDGYCCVFLCDEDGEYIKARHESYSNSSGLLMEGISFTPEKEFQNHRIHLSIPSYTLPKCKNKRIDCLVELRREINGEWKTIDSQRESIILNNENPALYEPNDEIDSLAAPL